MILGVHCDHPTFRSVKFKNGFNVVVAKRTKESTIKDSRNRLGKTTLIEIIHFCLGSGFKNSPLNKPELQDWTFFLDIQLKGKDYRISRNTKNHSYVEIEGDFSDWPTQLFRDKKTGTYRLKTGKDGYLNPALGSVMFDLPDNCQNLKYNPTFRSLISYFARRTRDAYGNPFEFMGKQSEWSKQVHNAFLLGLEWEDASELQHLKDKEKSINYLKKAAKSSSGVISDIIGNEGKMEVKKVRLEEKAISERNALASFRVHPQYKEIEDKTNELTVRIHQISNGIINNKRLIDFYENSLISEKPAEMDNVIEIYKEAGIVLSDFIIKRLDDVKEFHHQITQNRKSFLQNEIERLKKDTTDKEKEKVKIINERAELQVLLKTHGALEEYTQLQQLHLKTESELEALKKRIEYLKKFKEEKSNLKIISEQHYKKSLLDYNERAIIKDKAISLFNSYSQELYEAPGNLIINLDKTGFKFKIEIEGSSSEGIEQMKIFCYDLMLAKLWSERDTSPGFLIHDTTIFDAPDERQVARAIQLAAIESQKLKGDCFFNIDDIVDWPSFINDLKSNELIGGKILSYTDEICKSFIHDFDVDVQEIEKNNKNLVIDAINQVLKDRNLYSPDLTEKAIFPANFWLTKDLNLISENELMQLNRLLLEETFPEIKRLEQSFQYICCLNSDKIPYNDFDESFILDDFTQLTLTDANEDGGLLGIRF